MRIDGELQKTPMKEFCIDKYGTVVRINNNCSCQRNAGPRRGLAGPQAVGSGQGDECSKHHWRSRSGRTGWGKEGCLVGDINANIS